MVPASQWCGGQHSDAELAAAKPKGMFGIFGR